MFFNNSPEGRYLSLTPGYMAERLEEWEVALLLDLGYQVR